MLYIAASYALFLLALYFFLAELRVLIAARRPGHDLGQGYIKRDLIVGGGLVAILASGQFFQFHQTGQTINLICAAVYSVLYLVMVVLSSPRLDILYTTHDGRLSTSKNALYVVIPFTLIFIALPWLT
jgi:hypothetical protein